MNKKKIFSIMSSGILAFSVGAPSVLAGAPLIQEMVEDIKITQKSISLLEIVNMGNKELEKVLSNIYIVKSDSEGFILRGDNNTYKLNITIADHESYTIEGKGFSLSIIPQEEDIHKNMTIEVNLDENNVETIDIMISEVLESLEHTESIDFEESDSQSILERENEIIETDEKSKDKTITEEEDDESLKKESANKSIEEPIEEESAEQNTEEPVEEESIEQSTEQPLEEDITNQSDKKSDGDISEKSVPLKDTGTTENKANDQENDSGNNVSLERSSDIEALLHGEESMAQTFSMFSSMFTRSVSRTHENGIYTVKSGDNFNSIASSFNLSSAQLKYWNSHVSNINILNVGTELAVTRRGVEKMLSDADKSRLYTGGATSDFSTRQEFIDEIAPRAISVANQDGQEALWPSLMIAQAAHESAFGQSSLSSAPYYNLSGIKGTHNGNSVLMWTWEVFEGSRVDILGGFRHYPSYTESLQDYANLMRRGLSWSRDYYSGTWQSNTNSVWEVLDNKGLRGYATDPKYYSKIRSTIEAYDLTRFDDLELEEIEPEVIENVADSKSVSYSGILKSGYSIDTLPWGMKGYQRIGFTKEHSNQLVKVIKKSKSGAYLLIEKEGKVLGWVDHKSVKSEPSRLPNATNISYDIIINNGWYSIDSLPWGTSGYYRISNTTKYTGQRLSVVQKTKNGNYLLIEKNGQLIGWVDHRSVRRAVEVKNISSSFPVDYRVRIKSGGFSLDSLPWGTEGYERINWTTDFVGKEVQVTHESGAYALVSLNGTALGWVDKRALSGIPVRQNFSAANFVNYSAKLSSGFTIDTLPWGVNGHSRISRTHFYSGETVHVHNQTGSYALIEIRGRRIGWVDRRALTK